MNDIFVIAFERKLQKMSARPSWKLVIVSQHAYISDQMLVV